MRIGINMAQARGLGSSRIGISFLRGLSSLATALTHDFVAWIPHAWPAGPVPSGPFLLRRVRSSTVRKFWNDNVVIRAEMRYFGVDALISISDTVPPFLPLPQVLFVHQAFLVYPPSSWDFYVPWSLRTKMALMSAYFHLGKNSVDRFVVQTEHMRSAMHERWKIPTDHIEIIPSAVEVSTGWRARPRNQEPSLAVVSSASDYKNLKILPETMAELVQKVPEIRCYVTVHPSDVPRLHAEIHRLGVADRFVFLGRLPHEEALELMASATVNLVPSKLESFGLPYWEGLAVGSAMVVSDLVFGREICGDAALYAKPNEPADWANKILGLIQNTQQAEELRRKAKVRFQAHALTPDEMVRRFVRCVEEIVS